MDFALAHALSQAAVFHDLPTAAHNWRVTMYAQAFAESLNLSESQTQRFMMAALLHDLGKIDVPHEILSKRGPLLEEEFTILKQHTLHGYQRLLRMGERDEIILAVARWHHERIDGSGYPDGLKGGQIPAPARYFAVIDAFDAMTSLRSYRPEDQVRTSTQGLEELVAENGRTFCSDAVAVMIRLYAEGRIDTICSHLNDNSALQELEVMPITDACVRARLLLRDSTPEGMPDISHILNARAG
jgi:HD-GYP domain-containing protein (c-di-GMP phosphodiesterase class II)